jgi:hypothetical protein
MSTRIFSPYQRAIEELIDELCRNQEIDPLLFALISQSVPKALFGEDVKVSDEPGFARGFFRVDSTPTTAEERKNCLKGFLGKAMTFRGEAGTRVMYTLHTNFSVKNYQ